MSGAFVLAFSSGRADWTFPTLARLAAAIVAERDAHAEQPEISATRAILSRSGGLPGGAVVSVRLRDGAMGGRGSHLGYAFLPLHPQQREARQLMDAILAATAQPKAAA